MLMLGVYRFSVDAAAYQSKGRSTSYRWGKQDRLMTDPALQFIGPGDDTLSIAGVIYPHYKGGLGQLDAMRLMAGTGQPLFLMEGTGKALGYWVIESISENQSVFEPNGVAQRIEFSLSLRKSQSIQSIALNNQALITNNRLLAEASR